MRGGFFLFPAGAPFERPPLCIGSGAGYAGDRLEPSLELIEKGNLDYISYECLAERTIAIGQQAKLKDPTKGYNGLLEYRMEKALPLAWKHKVKIITNMGSANPEAAAQKCVEIARKHGLTGMKIACVTGDDILPIIDRYADTKVWETHEPLSKLPGQIVSANAYLGVEGIVKALEQGADVVITGRVSDPAIFLAPMIYEFGWKADDWDLLGKGTKVYQRATTDSNSYTLGKSGVVQVCKVKGDWALVQTLGDRGLYAFVKIDKLKNITKI